MDMYSYESGDDCDAQPNQLSAEYFGPAALIPFPAHQSPSRAAMSTAYMGQRLITINSKAPVVSTGLDDAYCKYTFRIDMERDGTVVAIYYKTPENDIKNAYILFQSSGNNGEFELFIVETEHCSIKTPTFGFTYVFTDLIKRVRPGVMFRKGDVFAHSPSINTELGYEADHSAVTPRTLMVSDPATGEDSIKFCKEALEEYKFHMFATITVNTTTNQVPLNLYGDDEVYKSWPNVGEKVRDDGIIFAVRTVDNVALAPQALGHRALKTPDLIFDTCYNAPPGSEVISVNVLHDDTDPTPFPHAESQLLAYHNIKYAWMKQLYDRCMNYRRDAERGGLRVSFSPELNQLLTYCYAVVYRKQIRSDDNNPSSVVLINKHTKVAPFRIVFTIRHEVVPGRGFKFSDRSGSKGVQGFEIVPRSQMPFDENGRYVDVIVSANSTVNRQNPNRDFEHYIGAVAEKIEQRVISDVTSRMGQVDRSHISKTRALVARMGDEEVMTLTDWIMGGYAIVNSDIAKLYERGVYPNSIAQRRELLACVIRFGATCVVKHDEPRDTKAIIADIEESIYRPQRHFLQWRDANGKLHRYEREMLVAPLLMHLLYKLPNEGNAQSSSVRTPHDTPAGTRRPDLVRKPGRFTGSRGLGESENRMALNMAQHGPALLFNLSHSSQACRTFVGRVLSSERPTALVDPLSDVPLGETRIHGVVGHIFSVFGIELRYINNERG